MWCWLNRGARSRIGRATVSNLRGCWSGLFVVPTLWGDGLGLGVARANLPDGLNGLFSVIFRIESWVWSSRTTGISWKLLQVNGFKSLVLLSVMHLLSREFRS